ncbi:hypothetical protein ACFODT_01725 [Vibrio zhugei]|uniref:Uncharacterized protein n=1 Tax=Vibrio zhugei TaxID=2479546 RepID=A0ABV7C3N3_9VIBR|nr:hypothetical protein [Vibrio zhugei]
MSKISISVSKPLDNIDAAKFLHKTLGMSLVAAKKTLGYGYEGVFFTAELFLNDYSEVAKKIRSILRYFDSIGVELYIVEISSEEDWEGKINDDNRISREELINILDESEDKYE